MSSNSLAAICTAAIGGSSIDVVKKSEELVVIEKNGKIAVINKNASKEFQDKIFSQI